MKIHKGLSHQGTQSVSACKLNNRKSKSHAHMDFQKARKEYTNRIDDSLFFAIQATCNHHSYFYKQRKSLRGVSVNLVSQKIWLGNKIYIWTKSFHALSAYHKDFLLLSYIPKKSAIINFQTEFIVLKIKNLFSLLFTSNVPHTTTLLSGYCYCHWFIATISILKSTKNNFWWII